MKNYLSFITFAMMAVFSLSFMSCGDDDEDVYEASVVGTWEVTYVKATSSYDMYGGYNVGDRMTFYSDGRYKDSEDTGRWSKNGNTLTLTIDDDDFSIPAVMVITKLTDTILEVKLDYGSLLKFDVKMKKVL